MRLGIHCNRLAHLSERLTGNGLHRGEFYNFPPQDLPVLKHWLLEHDIAMSIHTPLARVDWYPQPPTWSFLCDPDKDKRELNMRLVSDTMNLAGDFGAEYFVVHYPAPPQSDITFVSEQKLRDIARGSADWLANLSQKREIPIHIEGFGPSPFLDADFLIEVLKEFSTLRYCFDSGHMHLAALRDGIDYFAFAEKVAPYVASVHLWNNRGPDDYWKYRHIPVHPSQKPEEGWADIAKLLETFKSSKPFVILESSDQYPKELGNHDYREGVEWVKDLLKE